MLQLLREVLVIFLYLQWYQVILLTITTELIVNFNNIRKDYYMMKKSLALLQTEYLDNKQELSERIAGEIGIFIGETISIIVSNGIQVGLLVLFIRFIIKFFI